MNTNRQKILIKNDGIASKCVKHCKTSRKSTEKVIKPHTRTPSIKCHEEVICKSSSQLKPNYFTCELDCPSEKGDLKSVKQSKSKGNTTRNMLSKSSIKNKMDYESLNEKVYPGVKDLFHESMKSKSAPSVQNPNLEDSVDFIPVKLTSKNNNFQKVSHKPKSVCSENLKNNRGPTWDQLLKGDSQSVKNSVVNQSRPGNRNDTNHHHPPENSQDTSKKKVYCSSSKETDSKVDNVLAPTSKISNSSKSDEIDNKIHISNPVKTLDTLIEKLRERILKQPQNDNLNKIIVDMESALHKISFNEDQEKTTESEIYSSVKSSVDISSKSPQSTETKQSNIGELDIGSLKRNLEESCLFLQSLCIKQRENCTSHVREKEQLSIQLAESRRLLAVAKSREKDYEKTIGELRLKLQETVSVKEQQSKSLQELKDRFAKLKYENETLGSVSSRLKECSAEKDILQSKLYLKDLEIEKLKVLLEVKENLNPSSKHFNNKKFEKENIEDDLKLDIPNHDKGIILSSLSESSLNLSKPRIICSSQASSSPRRSPSPYDSWQHISSIPQDLTEINDLRNSIVRAFNVMKDTEWGDSLELDLEEPLAPSFSSDEDDDKLKPKTDKLCNGSVEMLSS